MGERSYRNSPRGSIIGYRDQLDNQTHSDVIWEPYNTERLQGLNPLCLQGSESYLAEVPLICYVTIEWIYPRRVLRQFGMLPEIPPNPNIEFISLHKFDKKRASKTFVRSMEQNYIRLWNDRSRRTVHAIPWNGEDHVALQAYLDWYDGITRRFIHPPKLRPPMRYNPIATENAASVARSKTIMKLAREGKKKKNVTGMRKILDSIFSMCKTHVDSVEVPMAMTQSPENSSSDSRDNEEVGGPSQVTQDDENPLMNARPQRDRKRRKVFSPS